MHNVAYTTDPEFINRKAWAIRWSDRQESSTLAQRVLDQGSESSAAGRALRTLAWQAKWVGDFDDSEGRCLHALQHLNADRDAAVLADVHGVLAVIRYSRGRRDLARDSVDTGFALLGSGGPAETRIDLLCSLATINRYAKRNRDALDALQVALDLATGVELARVHHNLARALIHMTRTDEGLIEANLAVSHAREHTNRVILPYALELIGAGHHAQGKHDLALDALTEAEAIAQQDRDSRACCQILYQISLVHEATGAPEQALTTAIRGLALSRQVHYPLWEKNFLELIARLHEAQGNIAGALDTMKSLHEVTSREHE